MRTPRSPSPRSLAWVQDSVQVAHSLRVLLTRKSRRLNESVDGYEPGGRKFESCGAADVFNWLRNGPSWPCEQPRTIRHRSTIENSPPTGFGPFVGTDLFGSNSASALVCSGFHCFQNPCSARNCSRLTSRGRSGAAHSSGRRARIQRTARFAMICCGSGGLLLREREPPRGPVTDQCRFACCRTSSRLGPSLRYSVDRNLSMVAATIRWPCAL